jgi:hypothetical protein
MEPDEKVKAAASACGEADKILVKQAEAEAESKALQGQGTANQRRATSKDPKTGWKHFRRQSKARLRRI